MHPDTNVIRRDIALGTPADGTGRLTLQAGVLLQDRYEIIDILGIGGMSTVYLARDRRFARATKYCAIKEMLDQARDPGTRQLHFSTFEREANVLASLNHPAIPKIYDFFTENHRVYLVMEYVRGKNLEHLLKETNAFFPQEQVVSWGIRLCDVLIYLHGQEPNPIIFRDMKPANVMLSEGHRLMLIDFGIARVFQAGIKGTMIGTEGYSPPEQYKGVVTPAADIYALGATLHHLLTRRDPRLETPFTFHERPPRRINPAISPALEACVMKALAYDIEDRYRSAAEMKMALLELVQTGHLDLSRYDLASQATAGAAALPSIQPTDAEAKRLLWKFACEEEVRSSPVVAAGLVLVGCYDHNLYALDAREGTFRWKFPTEAGISASPCVEGDTVFIGSEDGNLYAIHMRDGRSLWTFRTMGPIRSSPRTTQNLVLVGSDDHHLYAVDGRWGRQVWKSRLWGRIRSTPFIDGSIVYVGCDDNHVYAINLDAGDVRWRSATQSRVISSPTCAEGLVFVGSGDRHVYALDPETGWAVWRYRTKHQVTSSPAYGEGRIYIGSVDGALYCLEARTGRLFWTYETEGQVTSSPRLAEGLVFFGSTDGHVYALDATSGKLRWRFKTGGPVPSSPFIMDGVVYIGSMDHHVYALKT